MLIKRRTNCSEKVCIFGTEKPIDFNDNFMVDSIVTLLATLIGNLMVTVIVNLMLDLIAD